MDLKVKEGKKLEKERWEQDKEDNGITLVKPRIVTCLQAAGVCGLEIGSKQHWVTWQTWTTPKFYAWGERLLDHMTNVYSKVCTTPRLPNKQIFTWRSSRGHVEWGRPAVRLARLLLSLLLLLRHHAQHTPHCKALSLPQACAHFLRLAAL